MGLGIKIFALRTLREGLTGNKKVQLVISLGNKLCKRDGSLQHKPSGHTFIPVVTSITMYAVRETGTLHQFPPVLYCSNRVGCWLNCYLLCG